MTNHPLASLETDICEIAEMAELSACYVVDVITESENTSLGSQECRMLKFCAYHLQNMVLKLKDDFYEKLEAGRPVKP